MSIVLIIAAFMSHTFAQEAPVFRPGDDVPLQVCAFRASRQVNIALNEVAVAVITSDTKGCVTVPARVTSCEPALVAFADDEREARVGANAIVLTGPDPQGQPRSETTAFELACRLPREGGRNWLPIIGVGVLAAGLVAGGIALEARNRRRSREV